MSGLLPFALRCLPAALASKLLINQLGKPRPVGIAAEEQTALSSAKRRHWCTGQSHTAYQWGDGAVDVVCFHGWGGRASQMAPLCQYLHSQGYTALAPDFGGHGESPGQAISFAQLIGEVKSLIDECAPEAHTVIGHSAGGLSAMAARCQNSIAAHNWICLNTPVSPYPPVDVIKRKAQPKAAVLNRFNQTILRDFGGLISAQGELHCFEPRANDRLLLINDRDDRIVDAQDAETIQQQWPEIECQLTQGLGHQRILSSPDVFNRIKAFIAPD